MMTYTFNIEQQGKGMDILKQAATLVEMRLEIEAATASLTCPNHKFDSSATRRDFSRHFRHIIDRESKNDLTLFALSGPINAGPT